MTDREAQQAAQTAFKLRAFDELFNDFGIEEEQLNGATDKFKLNSNNKEFDTAMKTVHADHYNRLQYENMIQKQK